MAPYVVLFLRMIRCTNLMSFEHLAKNSNSAQLSEAFAQKIGVFPVGTIADIDYIMKYTIHNTHHVHSLYFKVKNDTSKILQDAVEHGKEYIYMIGIINSIVLTPLNPGDTNLKDSPLYYKLLLCAKPLYDLVHSLIYNIDVNNLPRKIPVHLQAGLIEVMRTEWRRKAAITIVMTFTKGQLLYYVYQNYNDGIGMRLENCVDIFFTGHKTLLESEQDDDSNSDYAKSILGYPILLSWPLRDIKVFRGCSKRRRERHATSNIMYYAFPYLNKLHQDSSMHRDEMTMFWTLVQIKETQRANRIIRNINYDTESVVRSLVPSVTLPPIMISSVLEVDTKRNAQQQKCPQWSQFAVAMRPNPAPVG